MAFHPVYQAEGRTGLIAALRRKIEEHVSAKASFIATRISRIGMKDGAGFILVEHARAVKVFELVLSHLEVVIDLALREFLRSERYVVVVVEIVAIRRYPVKAPFHALLVSLDLVQRRARDRHEGDIVMLQMHVRAVNVIGQERAPDTSNLFAGAEHEVIDDQLTAAVEELSERLLAVRRVEYVL